MNPSDDVHAFDDFAECRKPLPIGIAPAAEIEFGLVANTDEKVRGRRVGKGASHRNHSVFVFQTGDVCPFQLDRSNVVSGLFRVDTRLNDFDFDCIGWLIVRFESDRAMKSTAVIMTSIHITQKVS